LFIPSGVLISGHQFYNLQRSWLTLPI